MEEKGLPRKAVLKKLRSYLGEDFTYESGSLIHCVCTKPHDFASKIYALCLEKNLGDPVIFPGTVKIEKEVVGMLGSLLSHPNAAGHIVSGGTEANIMAIWAARNLAKKEKPEMIAPISAHYSIERAAEMLNIKLIKTPLNRQFRADVKSIKKAITRNTIVIVGTAGTTNYSTVDPIDKLSEIALENDIYLHVDAAFGGLILPFLKELGYSVPEFDFKLKGVQSITVDPHKMGMIPIPAGGILFRDESILRSISIEVPYLSGLEEHSTQATVLGTRTGAPVIATWALFKHLGREGYRKIAKKCMNLTQMLIEGVKKIKGLKLVVEPTMNIVAITSMTIDIRHLVRKLRKKGWVTTYFDNSMRIVVMPHVKAQHIKAFLSDLREIVKRG